MLERDDIEIGSISPQSLMCVLAALKNVKQAAIQIQSVQLEIRGINEKTQIAMRGYPSLDNISGHKGIYYLSKPTTAAKLLKKEKGDGHLKDRGGKLVLAICDPLGKEIRSYDLGGLYPAGYRDFDWKSIDNGDRVMAKRLPFICSFNAVKASCLKKQQYNAMNNVKMAIECGGYHLAASDGFQFSVATISEGALQAQARTALIPPELIAAIPKAGSRSKSEPSEWLFMFGDNRVAIRAGNIYYATALPEGTFPDLQIPCLSTLNSFCDRKELIDQLEIAALYDAKRSVKLTTDPLLQQLVIEMDDPEHGAMRASIDCQCRGYQENTFSIERLLKLAKAAKGKTLQFTLLHPLGGFHGLAAYDDTTADTFSILSRTKVSDKRKPFAEDLQPTRATFAVERDPNSLTVIGKFSQAVVTDADTIAALESMLDAESLKLSKAQYKQLSPVKA